MFKIRLLFFVAQIKFSKIDIMRTFKTEQKFKKRVADVAGITFIALIWK